MWISKKEHDMIIQLNRDLNDCNEELRSENEYLRLEKDNAEMRAKDFARKIYEIEIALNTQQYNSLENLQNKLKSILATAKSN